MTKYFQIMLTNGRTYEKNIPESVLKDIPIGATADHPMYQLMAKELAVNGFCELRDIGTTPVERRPRWIAPSQIKHVDVVFTKEATIKTLQ